MRIFTTQGSRLRPTWAQSWLVKKNDIQLDKKKNGLGFPYRLCSMRPLDMHEITKNEQSLLDISDPEDLYSTDQPDPS